MQQYMLRNKELIPRFVVVAIASWVISLTALTLIGGAAWITSSWLHYDALSALPRPLLILLRLCGAYAGLGAICLWVAMWIYWIAVERSSIGVRIGWFLALVFALHYGALFYAYSVWYSGIEKIESPHDLADAAMTGGA